MINFFKKLFGLTATVETPKETVKEILTPPAKVESTTTYIPPAKPVNKVRAVGETGANAVAAATAPKPANKQRKPYKGNKPKAKPVTEGNTKGGNNVVKLQQPAKKPQAPKAPVAKKK